MTIRKTLEQVAEVVGGTLRDDYSGRGMFGKQCYGIDCDNWAECVEEAAIAGIRNAKYDQMGKGYIVYWPNTDPSKE